MNEQQKPELIVCIPSRVNISDVTAGYLQGHLDGARLLTAYRLPVATARNLLAKWARESCEPYFLWLDDDCWFTREHVETALGILEDNPA